MTSHESERHRLFNEAALRPGPIGRMARAWQAGELDDDELMAAMGQAPGVREGVERLVEEIDELGPEGFLAAHGATRPTLPDTIHPRDLGLSPELERLLARFGLMDRPLDVRPGAVAATLADLRRRHGDDGPSAASVS